MKLIRLLALLTACLFAMAAGAQQNPPAQGSGEHKHGGQAGRMGNMDDMMQELTTKLNLTADQQTKIRSIMEQQHEQMRATMNDQSLSKEDKQAKMKSMHDSIHAKVREVLTDEQKPKFDAMVKDMENMHGKNGQGPDHDHK